MASLILSRLPSSSPSVSRIIVMRREINRIIERRASRPSGGTRDRTLRPNRTAGTTDSTGVDLRLIQRVPEPTDGVGEVLQKGDVDVEADDEGLVFLAQRTLEKRSSKFFFHIEHTHLAAAGIDQNTKSQRKICFSLEILDSLGLAILEKIKIILVEIGNQRTVLIFDIEKQLDDFDVDLQGFDGLILRLVA